MIKAVIFDMDGVIIDSEPVHFESDRMVMKDFGLEITDSVLSKYVGVSNPEMWDDLRIDYKISASVEEIVKKQMIYKVQLFTSRKLSPIEGITDLLHTLKKQNVRIGLASSSPREFISLILNRLGITEYFHAIMSGEEVTKGKPEPDIFLKTAELLNTNPESCIVIEDSSQGIKAAKAAGMVSIGFMNPNSYNQNLTLSDFIVNSIKEAEAIVMPLL